MAIEIRTAEDVARWDGSEPYFIPLLTTESEDDPTPEVSEGEAERVEALEQLMVDRWRELQSATPGSVTVEFTETHAVFTTTEDTVVAVSGDVRNDGEMKIEVGKTKERKLTDEGNGWVAVDGYRWEVPS